MADGSEERVNLLTIDSWYTKISDKLKFKCFKELATVKFTPPLNLKTGEQAAKDTEKLKKSVKAGKGTKKQVIDSYYMNIAEELNDFDEWCISERGVWGIPIPYFTRKDTGEVLFDGEIARYVADIFRKQGGSDAWYKLSVSELLPERYRSEAEHLAKGTQIFDVWFDNALSWDFALNKDAHQESQAAINMEQ